MVTRSTSPLKPDQPGRFSSRCILFHNESRSVFLVDIPSSLEESQVLLGQSAETTPAGGLRRLLSTDPVAAPFTLPEPRDPFANLQNGTPASQLADLMIEAAVRRALITLKTNYTAPFCLPRVTRGDSITTSINIDGSSSNTSSRGQTDRSSTRQDVVEDAATAAVADAAAAAAAAAAHFIPESSTFLCGTIETTRASFIATAPTFDLIVLDPPWPNKSARRKKTGGYSTVYGLKETRQLLEQIPVARHLADGGLVAIWVTNKPSLVDLLTSPNGILAGWSLEIAAEWIWVKITSQGEPIFDTESAWRKPWERLIIARRRGDNRKVVQRIIIAVPDVHSRKPNLRCLFEDLLPQGFRGLEVFARNLTAGWWGWGDETLRFQEARHWAALPESKMARVDESNEPDDTN